MDKTVEVSQAARELLPCPFCGGAPTIEFSHESGRWDIYEVECPACQVNKWSDHGFNGEQAKFSAIAAWNTRATQPDVLHGIGASFNRDDDSWHFYEQAADGTSRPLQLILKGYDGAQRIIDLLRAGNAALSEPRATQPEAALREALERIDGFVRKYFEPWGSWKTAWWEGEVSDEAAFSDHNALMHVANLARAVASTLSPAEPSPESREGWQPIETAKREQRVLIDGGHHGVTEAMLMEDGKWHVAAYNGTHPIDNPTVWMPLPASAIRALLAPAHD